MPKSTRQMQYTGVFLILSMHYLNNDNVNLIDNKEQKASNISIYIRRSKTYLYK